MIEKKKIAYLIASIAVFMAMVFVIPFYMTQAAVIGGQVISKIPCTCGPVQIGSQVTIRGPAGSGTYLDLSDMGGSRSYKHFFISIGRKILGLSNPAPAVCMVGVPPECTDIGISNGTIRMFGSSLY